MSFERIKTVKGHQYKYLVENYREAGKNKQRILKYYGRVDKPEFQILNNQKEMLKYLVLKENHTGGWDDEKRPEPELFKLNMKQAISKYLAPKLLKQKAKIYFKLTKDFSLIRDLTEFEIYEQILFIEKLDNMTLEEFTNYTKERIEKVKLEPAIS